MKTETDRWGIFLEKTPPIWVTKVPLVPHEHSESGPQ
uniref:Uncharacterized protein n=1 Tax=Anguilla anguilla TaxID=7936 RepID=A0A0E9R4P8_ANGAN